MKKGRYTVHSDDGATLPELLIVILITAFMGVVVLSSIAAAGRFITGQFELQEERASVSKAVALMETSIRSNDVASGTLISKALPNELHLKTYAGKGLVADDGSYTSSHVIVFKVVGTQLVQCDKTPRCVTLVKNVQNNRREPIFKYFKINPRKHDCRELLRVPSSGLNNISRAKVALIEVNISVLTPGQVVNKHMANGTQIIRLNDPATQKAYSNVRECQH